METAFYRASQLAFDLDRQATFYRASLDLERQAKDIVKAAFKAWIKEEMNDDIPDWCKCGKGSLIKFITPKEKRKIGIVQGGILYNHHNQQHGLVVRGVLPPWKTYLVNNVINTAHHNSHSFLVSEFVG